MCANVSPVLGTLLSMTMLAMLPKNPAISMSGRKPVLMPQTIKGGTAAATATAVAAAAEVVGSAMAYFGRALSGSVM